MNAGLAGKTGVSGKVGDAGVSGGVGQTGDARSTGTSGKANGIRCAAPIAQSAEAADLKSAQCGFESHWGHKRLRREKWELARTSEPIEFVEWCDGV